MANVRAVAVGAPTAKLPPLMDKGGALSAPPAEVVADKHETVTFPVAPGATPFTVCTPVAATAGCNRFVATPALVM